MEQTQWIFWLEELNQHHRLTVGRKCANLGEMLRAGFPVPPGYALGVDAYQKFFVMTGLAEKISEYLESCRLNNQLKFTQYQEISRQLRQMIEEQEMPAEMQELIVQYYRHLEEKSQVENVPVAVRSSGPVSMPGQFETYLNVRGAENVIRQIVRCWASTFTTQALAYRLQKGMELVSPIGVAVLKMVNSRSSGVAFTIHPTTGDKNKAVVEGSWGLGESVVGGDIAPDRFVVDKKTFQVEATVNRKDKQIIYGENGTCEAEVPPELQETPCLTQAELEKIVRLALRLEEYYGVAQDVEWAIDQDLPPEESLLLVQTRPVSKIVDRKESHSHSIADLLVRNVFNR